MTSQLRKDLKTT